VVSFNNMCTNVPMSLQEYEALLLGIDPMNWLHVMLELEYPIIDHLRVTTLRSSSCSTVDLQTR
jgi:hypothetical protein